MAVDFKIHSFSHLIKAFFGSIERFFGRLSYSEKELVVVNYHSTPKKFIRQFERQIEFYKRHFNIIYPEQLNEYYRNELKSDRCNLLITFDDGLKNNLNAADILEKHNLRALFFIVPGFPETSKNEQKPFYLKNIRPIINENIDKEEEDFIALSWDELNQLKKKSHGIGSHTYTHTLSVKRTTPVNSEMEIAESKKKIEERLNCNVTSFCSINNTLESTGSSEKKLISENYSYHFTTFPGLNAENKNPLFIKRRNVESFWLLGAIYYALGKSDLRRWKKEIADYDNL